MSFALAIALTLLLAGSTIAQEPEPSPPPPAGVEEPEPDISIDATVRWRSLRFEHVGTPRVEFTGGAKDTVWETDRVRLPKPVQPGVTYRDGQIHLRIRASLGELIHSALEEEAAPKVVPPSPEPR